MRFTHKIDVIDTHTAGQATRIITGGIPALRGNSMLEKKLYLKEHLDEIRRLAMHEPRGHRDMFGAVLTEPTRPEADFGMIFIDGADYLNMCGHGTIGVATALVECGLVNVTEPYTDLRLEAPAGLISVRVKVEQGRAREVSFVNVPAFLYASDVQVTLPNWGRVSCDIAFGGSFFALVKDSELGVAIAPDNLPEIVPRALGLMQHLNEQFPVQHPGLPVNRVELVEVYGPPKSPAADVQNVVVLGEGEVDRSPCGTGTCAKLAALHARGELAVGQSFVHESVIGTTFRARVLEECRVGEFAAVLPEITGSAYICGFSQLLVSPDDPVKYGFTLH